MAWARKLPSGRWQAGGRDPHGNALKIQGTWARKTDAKAAGEQAEEQAKKEEEQKKTGEWIDPALAQTRFGDLAEKWLKKRYIRLKPKTIASYESLLKSRVLPTFEHKPIREILPSDVESWVDAMVAEGLSPSRIHQAHVVLKMVLGVAVTDGYLPRNVALGVKPPPIRHHEAPFLEPQVVDALVDAIAAPYGTLVAVMGVCGLRWGEAVALRRRHVDALRRRLIVEDSLAEINGTLIFGDTKSHAKRSVPLSPRVMALLNQAVDGKGRDALVFTSAEGGPVRYRNFLSRVWHPLLRELELPAMGVHVLRHSAAARMISKGASHKTLQTVLGHRSASFSLTVYGHLFDADLDALADRLDTPSERKAQ